jgi:4-aminobutyrate aminotransferase-like enzyme
MGLGRPQSLCETASRRDGPMPRRPNCSSRAGKGLLLLRSGLHHNVVRTLMPLTISDSEPDEGLA